MATVDYRTLPVRINDWTIIHLPEDISKELPSRGMVMGEGTIGGVHRVVALEPDGKGGHWFRVDDWLEVTAGQTNTIEVVLSPSDKWTEPPLPKDLKEALETAGLMDRWDTVTTKAHWEWIRWIRFTPNPATRQKRIRTACDMLSQGKKRPCCFDHSRCTVMEVSKGGVLCV